MAFRIRFCDSMLKLGNMSLIAVSIAELGENVVSSVSVMFISSYELDHASSLSRQTTCTILVPLSGWTAYGSHYTVTVVSITMQKLGKMTESIIKDKPALTINKKGI